MVSLEDVGVNVAGGSLFEEIGWRVDLGNRVGLVGPNGAGKSTLLKILAGERTPDSGKVHRAKGTRLGYLPQDLPTDRITRSVFDEAKAAFAEVIAIGAEVDRLAAWLGQPDVDHQSAAYEKAIEQLGELQHEFEARDGFRIDAQTAQVLSGLGFSEKELYRPLASFSGGWRMRVMLAKILLARPDILLLDEPTNHLDLESIEWLEAYLQSLPSAVVIVSHDRAFLDHMVTKVVELGMGDGLNEYTGNYSAYEIEREKRKELIVNAYANQQQQLKQTEAFIERFRYKSTKARQVQSRIKQMDKIDRIELPDEQSTIRFQFPDPPRAGRIVASLRHLKKAYGQNLVLDDISLDIERTDRIALVGVNGAGKSTMARILAGEEAPDGGVRELGHNAMVAYYAQHQAEALPLNKTVLEVVDEAANDPDVRRRLRSMLGSFLFRGDDVFKPVSVLSGGEKSRLALCKILLQPANLLVLDEPTNHLDMASVQVLIEALQDFTGAFVVVSHDRYFLDQLARTVIEVRGHHLKTYLGNHAEYARLKAIEARAEVLAGKAESVAALSKDRPAAKSAPQPKVVEKPKTAEERKRESDQRAQQQRERRGVERQVQTVEASIAEKEEHRTQLEVQLADPAVHADADRLRTLSEQYRASEVELAHLYGRWEELSASLETA